MVQGNYTVIIADGKSSNAQQVKSKNKKAEIRHALHSASRQSQQINLFSSFLIEGNTFLQIAF